MNCAYPDDPTLKVFNAIIICTLLIFLVVGGLSFYFYKQLEQINKQLDRWDTGISILNIQSITTGEIKQYVAIGVAKITSAGKDEPTVMPLFVDQENFDEIRDRMRKQLIEYSMKNQKDEADGTMQ